VTRNFSASPNPKADRQAGLFFQQGLYATEYCGNKAVWIVESNFVHDRITETKPQKDPLYDDLPRLLSKISYQVRDRPHSVSETLEYRHAGDLPVRCAGFSY